MIVKKKSAPVMLYWYLKQFYSSVVSSFVISDLCEISCLPPEHFKSGKTPVPLAIIIISNPISFSMIHLQVIDDRVLVFDLEHVKTLRSLGIVGVLVGTLPKAPQQNVFLGLPLQLSVYEAVWLVEHDHAVLVDAPIYNSLAASSVEAINLKGKLRLSSDVNYATTPNSHSVSDTSSCLIKLDEFLHRQTLPPQFWAKYSAFRYLRSLQHFLMPGLRFGGVFVSYPGDPLKFHSHLIVKVLRPTERVNLLDLVTSGRLATAVKKAWVLIGEKEVTTESNESESKESEPKEPCKGSIRGDVQCIPPPGPIHAFSIEWAGFG